MNHRLATFSFLILILVAVTCMTVLAQSDIDDHRECVQCGMDRKAFGYSRMLVQYEDGAQVGLCSLHCAIVELGANKGRTLKSILVADRDTRELTDVEKAVWVIGGKKSGVMTQRAKWAFATNSSAQAFIASNGGTIASWNEALAAAREDAFPRPR
jgi:nitrous oxide reductase accessory protein NosL